VAGPGDHRRWRRGWRESDEKEKKGGGGRKLRPKRYDPKGASLDGTLLCPKGASEGGSLLSTMAWSSCHVRTLGCHQCWCPPTHLRRQPPWCPTDGSIYEKRFPCGLFVKKFFIRAKIKKYTSSTSTACALWAWHRSRTVDNKI
jgi:hypothetical protein